MADLEQGGYTTTPPPHAALEKKKLCRMARLVARSPWLMEYTYHLNTRRGQWWVEMGEGTVVGGDGGGDSGGWRWGRGQWWVEIGDTGRWGRGGDSSGGGGGGINKKGAH